MLKEQGAGAEDIVVFGGRIVTKCNREQLLEAGVKEIFVLGDSTTEIIERIRTNIK